MAKPAITNKTLESGPGDVGRYGRDRVGESPKKIAGVPSILVARPTL